MTCTDSPDTFMTGDTSVSKRQIQKEKKREKKKNKVSYMVLCWIPHTDRHGSNG